MHDEEGARGLSVPLGRVCHEYESLAVASNLFRRPHGGSVLMDVVLGKSTLYSKVSVIAQGVGSHFDPDIARTFLRIAD